MGKLATQPHHEMRIFIKFSLFLWLTFSKWKNSLHTGRSIVAYLIIIHQRVECFTRVCNYQLMQKKAVSKIRKKSFCDPSRIVTLFLPLTNVPAAWGLLHYSQKKKMFAFSISIGSLEVNEFDCTTSTRCICVHEWGELLDTAVDCNCNS